MAATNAQIVVPGRTYVYLGDVGTAAPTDVTTALAAAWNDMGYTTEDSLQLATNPNFIDIRSAQSDYPTRVVQTSDELTVSVELQQWNSENFIAAFGGGTVTGSGGSFKYTPPALGARKEFACIIEIVDGASKRYRYVFPRVAQREGVTQALSRGGEAKLPLRLSVQGSDGGGDAWYMLTNDTAFTPAT